MKLVKGQRVKITYKGYGFLDTGKIGIIVSPAIGRGHYYVYVKGSENNAHDCRDFDGNEVTWFLKTEDFILLEPDGQLLFEFMYN